MQLEGSIIKAVVFDLDNTLVSSSLDFASIREDIGCPCDHDLLDFADRLGCEQQKATVHRTIISHELADAKQAQLMQGSVDLLDHLHLSNIATGIVTRNCIQAAKMKLDKLKLEVNELICREHYPPKPAPDSLLALSELWSVAPHEMLYVGDYLYDIQAAINANMHSCLVTHHSTPDYGHLATICVPHLTDLHRLFASQ
ncbi:HAD family hydrolase [Vibrio sp. WXL210]|uniref:HAD family hydrolase n=1 Tax=Vibrio sp. WXL210 TaxID=3450709 RepID=UPI003EC62B12